MEEQVVLKCFLYKRDEQPKNILVYLHSFLGNAIEGKFLLELLGESYDVLLFDQRGCGNDPNEYVTLGMRESYDLERVLDFLSKEFGEVNLFLWGRQMGAAAIMHFLHQIEVQRRTFMYQEGLREYLDSKEEKKIQMKEKLSLLKETIKLHGNYCFQNVSLEIDDIEKNDLIYQKIKGIIIDSTFTSAH